MKITRIDKVKRWFLRFIQIQLLLSAVSFPILLGWGLPISVLSPLGNLLFLPVLTAFLMLSSIIFFLELLHLPNGLFIFFLEKITSWWLIALSFGTTPAWLVGFRRPSIFFLLTIPALALVIITHKKTSNIGRSIILLSLLLACSFGYLKLLNAPGTLIEQIACNGGEVTLVHAHGKTTVIDPGVIGRRISAPSWIEYTLAPTIVQTAGSNSIDHLIVLQPGICTFNALERLCSIMTVRTLYLTTWEGTLTKNGWRSFFQMKRAAQQYGTNIVRIGAYERQIKFTPNDNITITPSSTQKISYQSAHYPALSLRAQIDNQTFTLYSSKWKKGGSDPSHS